MPENFDVRVQLLKSMFGVLYANEPRRTSRIIKK